MGDAGRHMGLIGGRMNGRAGGRFGGRMGSVMEKRVVAPDPGGWQPTDIAGCQLWLKADAGITKDGSNYVSQWDDQSGNNNHAVQATGSAQPLWVDDGGLDFNNMPLVRFNGLNSNMVGNINHVDFGITTFIVMKSLNNSMSSGALIFQDSTMQNDYVSRGNFIIICNNNSNQIYYRGGVTGSYGDNFVNTLSLFSVDLTNNLDFNIVKAYVNGNNASQTISGPYSFTYDRYIIGCRFADNMFNYYLQMDLCEIIKYNSSLSDANRQLVENYINTKYAIW